MQINITYDSSVSGAPSGFKTAVQAAVQFLDTVITTPITVNLDFGWGEVDGQSLSAGAVGESQSNGILLSYSQFQSALQSAANNPNTLTAADDLPSTDPTSGGQIYLTNAEAKALGQMNANASGVDGWVGLDSSTTFTFDPNNRSVSGDVDAIGVLEHEISEDLGRISILGTEQQGGTDIFGPLDLYRYTSPGTLAPTSNTGSFSIDGQNLLKAFNNPSNGGDSGDWSSRDFGDAFDAFVDNGSEDPVSHTDLVVMDALGYQPAPVATDFTGVGMSDLLWQNTSGEVAIWTMNGTSATAGTLLGNPGTSWHVVGSGHFFGGVGADILWQYDSGQVAIWQMNGTSVVSGSLVGGDPGPTWHVMGTGDFYGTGMSDIVFQNDDGTVAIWEMNGFTATAGTVVADPGSSWHVVGTGDFNDDGKTDILLQDDGGSVAIWEMNGASIVGGGVFADPGTSWHVAGVGDFNGAGNADIVWQNTSGQVAIWMMNGTTVVAGALVATNPGPSWHIAGVGDYNGDGKSDILFQNSSGQEAIWEMEGFNVISASLVSSNPGSSWQLQGDGAAPYTIGSGYTIPLAGDTQQATSRQGLAALAPAEPLTGTSFGGHSMGLAIIAR